MSGMKNLANAVANDPGYSKTAGMSKSDAAQFVQPGSKAKPKGKSK